MKRNHLLTVAFFIAIGIPVAIAGWRTRYFAAESAKKSAVLALMDEIEREATSHYEEFGTYPSSLDEMEINVFPDGGDAALLKEIGYESDGGTMTLNWGKFQRKHEAEPSRAPQNAS